MIKINKPYLKDKIQISLNNQNKEIKTKTKVPLGIEKYLTKENIILVTQNIEKYCKTYNTTLAMKGNINLKESINKLSKNLK